MNKYELAKLKDIDTKEPEEIIIKNFNLINFRKKTVNYITARPGHCKTQQLINILVELGQIKTTNNKPKHKILFVSLEMTKEDIARRIQKLNKKGYEENLEKKMENILFYDKTPLTLNELKEILLELELNGEKIEILILDYVQLFEEPQEMISIEITKIAIDFNLIIISALQLNSSFNTKEPLLAMSHIAGSNRYSKDATSIVLIYKQEKTKINGYVIKNRHGITSDEGIPADLTENGEIIGNSNFYNETEINEKTKIIYKIGQIITLIALSNEENGKINYPKIDIEFDETKIKNDRTIALIFLAGAITTLITTRENLREHFDYAKKRIQEVLNYEYEIETGKNIKEIIEEKEKEQKHKKDEEKLKLWRTTIHEFITNNKHLIEEIYDKIGKEINKNNEKLSINDCQEIIDITNDKTKIFKSTNLTNLSCQTNLQTKINKTKQDSTK